MHHGLDLASYDHREFPGAVPRTFLGPLAVAAAAGPLAAAAGLLLSPATKAAGLFLSRAVLGTALVACFGYFRRGVRDSLGKGPAAAVSLLTCAQFHLPFYMSRPLPNTFALGLTLVACGDWLGAYPLARRKRTLACGCVTLGDDTVQACGAHGTRAGPPAPAPRGGWLAFRAVALLAFAAAVFRAEVALLLALVAAEATLVSGSLGLPAAAAAALLGGCSGGLLSLGVDSVFWGR